MQHVATRGSTPDAWVFDSSSCCFADRFPLWAYDLCTCLHLLQARNVTSLDRQYVASRPHIECTYSQTA